MDFPFNIIENIGIPAAVCFYTLFSINKTTRHLVDAVKVLTSHIDKLSDKIDNLRDDVKERVYPYHLFKLKNNGDEMIKIKDNN